MPVSPPCSDPFEFIDPSLLSLSATISIGENEIVSSPQVASEDEDEEDEDEENEEYEVEQILEERVVRRGRGRKKQLQFRIKWVGYEATTWEPAEALEDSIALDDFERRKVSESVR